MSRGECSVGRVVEIKTPGAIVFGAGACEQLGGRIKALSKGAVLIVTDAGLVKAGVAEEIEGLVSSAGIEAAIFDGVEPDPDKENVYECLEKVKSTGADVLVGLGGGSSLDVAKVAAVLSVNEGELADYVGIGKVPKRGLPTVLLPTTAGTGSEVSPIAVISDRKQHLKLGVVSEELYCDLAIVDAGLTVSCPANITASAGMDTLTHAIEIYTNKFAVDIIDAIELEAIRLVGRGA